MPHVGSYTVTTAWVDLKAQFTPNLADDTQYIAFNLFDTPVEILEQATAPTSADNGTGYPWAGGTERTITPESGNGFYVRSERPSIIAVAE